MYDLETRLARWVAAGLVEPDQAEAITRFEARRDPSTSLPHTASADGRAPDGPPSRHPAGRPGTAHGSQVAGAEAVGYVGAALVLGALGRIVAEVWPELLAWGRLTLAALVAVLAFATAAALVATPRAALQRLVSVALTVGVIATAWLGGLVASELLGWREAPVAVAASGAAFAAAVPIYVWRRRALAQATALATTVALALSLVFLPRLEVTTSWVGLLLWGLGLAWLLAGRGGWLTPARLAGVLGGLLALLGAQVGSFGDARLLWLSLAIATAAALVGAAVYGDTLSDLVVGALGLFVLMPQLVFELFGDAIGAPAALLIVGLLLLLLAVGLGRAGQKVRRVDPEPSAPAAGGPEPVLTGAPADAPAASPTSTTTGPDLRAGSDAGGDHR